MKDCDTDISPIMQEVLAGEGRSVTQLAGLIPPFRANRPATASMVTRWIIDGVRGADGRRVKLEAVRLSGRWVTTPGALARFLQAQQPLEGSGAPPATAPSRGRRNRDAATARSQLRAIGI